MQSQHQKGRSLLLQHVTHRCQSLVVFSVLKLPQQTRLETCEAQPSLCSVESSTCRVASLRQRVKAVAAANRHTVALVEMGHVYSWGCNLQGQLGYGTSDSASNAVPRIVEAMKVGASSIGLNPACQGRHYIASCACRFVQKQTRQCSACHETLGASSRQSLHSYVCRWIKGLRNTSAHTGKALSFLAQPWKGLVPEQHRV